MFRDKRLNYCLGISLAVNLLFVLLAGRTDLFHAALTVENLHPISLKWYKPIPVIPAVVPPMPIKPPEPIKPPVHMVKPPAPVQPALPLAKPPEPIKRTEPIKPAPQTIKPPTHIVKLPAPIKPPASMKFVPHIIKRTAPAKTASKVIKPPSIKQHSAMKIGTQANSHTIKIASKLQDDNSKVKPSPNREQPTQTSDNNFDHSGDSHQQDKSQEQAKKDKQEEKHEEVKPKNWVPIESQEASYPDNLGDSVSTDGIDSSTITNNKVIIAFVISEEGHVRNAHVRESSGNPDLDQRCIDAVRRARCVPAIQDHIPRDQTVRWTFNVS